MEIISLQWCLGLGRTLVPVTFLLGPRITDITVPVPIFRTAGLSCKKVVLWSHVNGGYFKTA